MFFVFLSMIWANAVSAQEEWELKLPGLNGQEMRCVSSLPGNENELLVGTDYGLYSYETAGKEPLKKVKGFLLERCGVRRFYMSHKPTPMIYAATEKGLLAIDPKTLQSDLIFKRSNPAEGDCLSVFVSDEGRIFLGTRAGLFVKESIKKGWQKKDGARKKSAKTRRRK